MPRPTDNALKASRLRSEAMHLAQEEQVEALKIARRITDPWFSCQALSAVGRYWPDEAFVDILQEAAEVATRAGDAYSVISVSAWPVRALLERGMPADFLCQRSLALAKTIENLGSRSEAVMMLLQAVLPFDQGVWRPVLDDLVMGSEPELSWRQRRNLRWAIQLLLGIAPDVAEEVAMKLSSPSLRQAAEKVLRNGTPVAPRGFFGR